MYDTILEILPTPEELSKLKIDKFKEILKDSSEDFHDPIFLMLHQVSVLFGLLDHQKWLQNYALEKKIEIEEEDIKDLYIMAIKTKHNDSAKLLLKLVDVEVKKDIEEEASNLLLEEVVKNRKKELRVNSKDSIVEEDKDIHKPLKKLSIVDLTKQDWFLYSVEEYVQQVLDHCLDVDLLSLKNLSFAMGNLFNSTKGIIIAPDSIWKPIFTSENEIIMYIAEFLSGGTGKYVKLAIPYIREALGINEKFIDLYSRVEDLDILGQDSDLDDVD